MYPKNDLTFLIKKDERILGFIQDYAFDGLWFLDTFDRTNCWINPKLKDVLGYKKNTENSFLDALFSSIVEQISLLNFLKKQSSTIKYWCIIIVIVIKSHEL